MKRIVMLLTVVALMAGTIAMTVAPAFADKGYYSCTRYSDGHTFVVGPAKIAKELERTGIADCERVHLNH